MSEWHQTETYKGMLPLAIETVRSLILVNGGAAVAILAYWSNAREAQPITLSCSLLVFAFGVVSAVLTFITAYLTQITLYNEEVAISEGKHTSRTHHRLLALALLLAFISAASFITGSTLAANALSNTKTKLVEPTR